MSVYNISNRYAIALLRQSEETNTFDTVAEDFDLVFNTLDGSKDLKMALSSPIINETKKRALIEEIFGGKISKESMNFLLFVISKSREEFLFNITKRFLELRDDKQNVVNAFVTTAVELGDNERKLFEEELKSYTGKNVRISYKINDNIIGGFLVKIKDQLVDASVSHQLEMLRKRLIREDQTLVN